MCLLFFALEIKCFENEFHRQSKDSNDAGNLRYTGVNATGIQCFGEAKIGQYDEYRRGLLRCARDDNEKALATTGPSRLRSSVI